MRASKIDPVKAKKTIRFGAVVVFILILVLSVKPFYILNEGQTAIITQFGKIVKAETEAGLHFKIPVLYQVHRYTAKLLRIDGDPQKILTKEKQFIEVNTTSRWRISDIRRFYQSLGTYESAYSRLSDIIDSSVRDIITVNSLNDVVRNTNSINEMVHQEQIGLNTDEVKLEEVTGAEKIVYAAIEKGRDVLAAEILKKANMQLKDFGIEVIDVIFKEIKYSDELQASVYNRMIKERNQIAQTFRSTGEGKKAEWLGKLENEKKSILSKAYSESEKIKGAADAQATAIYAASYGKSPEFYSFWKSLEVYQNALPDTEKILSTDMEYFQYLYKH